MGRNIESEALTIACPAEEIFSFLSDFNNFSHLVPEEVSNWQSDTDFCSFEVKGLATLGMRITERQPFSRIIMKGEGRLPFQFSLVCYINSSAENVSVVKLVMETDMSSIIAMMAEKPLSGFISLLIQRLKEVMESGSYRKG